VGSIAYFELGDNNGGIIINLSEGGLSLTAVGVLDGGHPQRIRVQPPRSRDWIELSGEFAWVSESRKEAGIRFHELTPEAGTRIKNWISLEASPPEIQRESGRYARRETPLPANPIDRAAEPSILAPEISQTAAPEAPRVPSISPTVNAPEIATMESAPQAAIQVPGASSDKAVGGENSSRSVERRSHARCRVKSLVYIDLGKSNCGIVANISENGLRLEAAVALTGDYVPEMRLQLPRSRKWIEASGKVIWNSESRRKAGIQLVDLPADVRELMKEWVSQEASPAEIPDPKEKAPENRKPTGQTRVKDEPRSQALVVGVSDETSRTAVRPAVPPPVLPATPTPPPQSAKVPVAVPAQSIRPPKVWHKAKHRPRAEKLAGWMKSAMPVQDWRILAASIALVLVLSFAAGWFAAREHIGNKTAPVAGLITRAASKSTKRVEPLSTNGDARPSNVPAPGAPSQGRPEPRTSAGRSASVAATATGSGGREAQHPPANSVSIAPTRTAKDLGQAGRPLETPAARPAAERPKHSTLETSSPAPKGMATPSTKSVAPSPSPMPARPVSAAAATNKEKESATPSPKLPEAPAIPAGSVSVNLPAFPSIRVPPELKSQSSRLGTSLQIGQLISRVEPAFPEEIRRQRIEGTVKLHAVIGRDGAVQSAALISGPPLLAPLAISAIREWRFKQTLLGGQPIETEEDITVVFRLANPATQSN
jgi:outer membrane biosynthesis protein TonB